MKNRYSKVESLIEAIHESQLDCHNYEEWGDEQYDRIDLAISELKAEIDRLYDENEKLRVDAQRSFEFHIEERFRLFTENQELKAILKEFLSTKECRTTWVEEMTSTIKSYFEEE